MKNGKCPMCGSTEVYKNSEAEVFFTDSPDEPEAPEVGLYDGNNELTVYLIPYICVKCGFTAMYVHDPKEIKDIPDLDGWDKVS